MKKIKYILLVLLLSNLIYAGDNQNEDTLIMKALVYSDSNPKEAANAWKKLFELTNNEKYLVEYFYASLAYRDIKDVIKELKVVLSKKKSKELYELLGGLYSKDGNTDGVIEVMEDMPTKDVSTMYELAYLYSLKGEDNKSLSMYKKIYNKEHGWKSLKGILSILYKQKKETEASELLWKAIKKDKLPTEAYMVYAGFLNLKKDSNKAIYVFKKLYSNTKDKKYIKQLISLYLYEKDYDSLIKLLEQTHYDDSLLYELYISKQESVKAFNLLDGLYEKTKNPKWIGEKAILTYEIANKYNAVDKRVIKAMANLFEKAFKLGLNSGMYYNYYGYTLIDYNYKVEKGIESVKKAVAIDSKNLFYLDSLAWGYYKVGKCAEAKKIAADMQKLDKIKEDDILEHIKKIENCKDR